MANTDPNPAVGAAMALCPDTAMPCGNVTNVECYNGGKCCEKIFDKSQFCACPQGFEGSQCEVKWFEMLMESTGKAMNMVSLSACISIVVGVIALIALGTIAFVIIRSSRKRRYWGLQPVDPEKDLDQTIVFVQEEISKLSTVQQLNKLHRLSKLFEKTVREAILSEPGHDIERTTSVAMNEHLPRWSSAPSCFNRPSNDLDMTDGLAGADEVFQKTKLQQVFSLQ